MEMRKVTDEAVLLPNTAVSLTSLTVWAYVPPDEREYYKMVHSITLA